MIQKLRGRVRGNTIELAGLSGLHDGDEVELNVRLLRAENAAAADSEWSEVKNTRRCWLIDKEIDDSLTPEERTELEQLQGQMLAYRRRVAPISLNGTRALHAELMNELGDHRGEK